ncbi:MAG: esterase-like activity of phytase family protein [Bacteroidales bacterium]|nr:esterase-like activity of phytase family protein [Bacteroidales bacterium]
MKTRNTLLFLLTFLMLCSCVQDANANSNPPEDGPAPEAPEGFPVFGEHSYFEVPQVSELSGMCLNSDRTALAVVGDEGTLAFVGFDGKTEVRGNFGKDFEGITADPAGNFLFAEEGGQAVYRSKAPSYGTPECLFFVKDAVDGNFGNKGLEGISYYKDDVLFVGAQKDATLWKYGADGTCLSKIILTTVTSEIKEVAGLCYDADEDWLWVSDSKAGKIFIFTPEGKLLAGYDVSYIDNAESLCLDRKNRCLWVGSDEKPSRIYRISLSF